MSAPEYKPAQVGETLNILSSWKVTGADDHFIYLMTEQIGATPGMPNHLTACISLENAETLSISQDEINLIVEARENGQ
jgi:hypothetical protein